MRHAPFKIISISSILLLIASSQIASSAGAQTPQRDNRPRGASISGRVIIAGKPAVNAAITVRETDLKTDAAGGSAAPAPIVVKARTDGEGRYIAGGLAEGRYVVSVMLKAFVAADNSEDFVQGRTVTIDAGEAREKVDFTLIRGGVITGKVIDEEGSPLIANRVQLYTLDEEGQKHEYARSVYELLETDDRGVYRVYGLPPGRYIVGAGGEGGGDMLRASGKFARVYHPEALDEKQAKIIEIKEGSEASDVDIRLASAIKTYEAAGRVIDKETGKAVPRIYIACALKPVDDRTASSYSATTITDGQGNFKLNGLPPGRYQHMVMDLLSESGYRSDTGEFEIANDNVSGIEVKVFLGASVSGFVVIEGAEASASAPLQSLTVHPSVTPLSDATGDTNGRSTMMGFRPPARVNPDGSFVLKGLQAGSVGFYLVAGSGQLPIKRVERDGVEVKDAIDVRPGEKITGVRIVANRALGRIRGQLQITGGALPDNWRLGAHAMQSPSAGEARSNDRAPVSINRTSGNAIVDEKGRFVIEGLPPGEYDLLIILSKLIANGGSESSGPPVLNQRVTIRENGEASVNMTLDLREINRPNKQPDNLPNNLEDRR
jgi:hypothetical protein